jgi:hypothetical protein
MKVRGGEFSTGTMGNFQPELTHPGKGNCQTCEEERNDSFFIGVCAVAVHTAPARLPEPNRPLGLLIAPHPSCRW